MSAAIIAFPKAATAGASAPATAPQPPKRREWSLYKRHRDDGHWRAKLRNGAALHIVRCSYSLIERTPDHWQVFFTRPGEAAPRGPYYPPVQERCWTRDAIGWPPAARFLDLDEAKRYAERHIWPLESGEQFTPLPFLELEPVTLWNRPNAKPIASLDEVARRLHQRWSLIIELEHGPSGCGPRPRYQEDELILLADMLPALSPELAATIRADLIAWDSVPQGGAR